MFIGFYLFAANVVYIVLSPIPAQLSFVPTAVHKGAKSSLASGEAN